MRIKIEFPIDCSADAAWRAAHMPTVASALYRPLLTMSAKRGSLPLRFESGDKVDVALRLFGILRVGSQQIAIDDVVQVDFPVGARTMRDSGHPLSGPLKLLTSWNHEITIWHVEPRTAVWHDELTIHGVFAPLFFMALKPMWLWRRAKLRRLARVWARESGTL